MNSREFYYHLKFEIYDSPHPATPQTKKRKIWLPARGTDIFGDWPSHLKGENTDALQRTEGRRADCEGIQEQIQGGLEVPSPQGKVIDCGPDRPRESQRSSIDSTREYTGLLRENITKPEQPLQSQERTATIAERDYRFGALRVEGVDMDSGNRQDVQSMTSIASFGSRRRHSPGINSGPMSQTTKARLEEIGGLKTTKIGWGIVHLYRDGEETPGLGFAPKAETSETVVPSSSNLGPGYTTDGKLTKDKGSEQDEDTTILCIPAVPSYMTPSDFLGWVGEETRDQVRHFRMVMTGQMNRYLVLLKFRDPAVAKKWQADWDGRIFGGLEPENCHVMFIKSIVFETPSKNSTGSFPYTSLDPFTPSLGTSTDTSLALKPFPPPTPALVELPTCPVCLERMDDTTGLLTILCQHVFHCACLTKWRGSGCPVCRHTQPTPSLSQPFGTTASDFCRVCDCPEDLWICLICGHVGCGRYKGGHAKDHWKESAHNYALEIETQHVWDYAGDLWVHRLIRDKGDGKLVELPSSRRDERAERETQDVEMVPRAKLDNIGLEYTAMLTNQLESQRVYFEDVVKKAVDKASSAAKVAETASLSAATALAQLEDLKSKHEKLSGEFSTLTKDRDRLAAKAEKGSDLVRGMTSKWQEEKKVGEGLLSRVNHMTEMVGKLRIEIGEVKRENAELKEENRDLGFFISSSEKLKGVEGELGEEIRGGTASVPEVVKKGKGKGRGK